jgi:hypothetical protein
MNVSNPYLPEGNSVSHINSVAGREKRSVEILLQFLYVVGRRSNFTDILRATSDASEAVRGSRTGSLGKTIRLLRKNAFASLKYKSKIFC